MAGQGFMKRFQAECDLQRNRQSPCQNPTTEPIDDRGEVDEAACHRNVGDVHRPDLVRPRHRQLA